MKWKKLRIRKYDSVSLVMESYEEALLSLLLHIGTTTYSYSSKYAVFCTLLSNTSSGRPDVAAAILSFPIAF